MMRRKSVCILTHSYMQQDGGKPEIGGVQTYVDALCRALSEQSAQIEVLQPSAVSFQKQISPSVKVVGVAGDAETLRKTYLREYQGKPALTIFAFFPWADWSNGETCIAIQHGISWDGFYTRHRGVKARLHQWYMRYLNWRDQKRTVRILDKVNELVCVDLNFPNWLRATYPFRRWEEKLTYIPNFGNPISAEAFAAVQNRNRNTLKVLIPRRFEQFRGVVLTARIVRDVAGAYPHCHFLFAGSGSQENKLRAILEGVKNCRVARIPHREIEAAYLDADITVVPTLWSEGTSLACIEAMCAANAVLVTNIGGLSNVILHDFNGLMVEPRYDALKDGLIRLLEDRQLRTRLGYHAYQTACACFSRERWTRRIKEVVCRYLR